MNRQHDPDNAAFVRPAGRRPLWWRLLLPLGLLLSGAVIGAGLTLIVLVRGLQFRVQHPELFAARATQRLQRTLDLTDGQAAEVEQVLRRHQEQIQAIRRDCQPRFERQVEEIRSEVSALLTPEQASKWQSWLDQRRRLWLPPLPSSAPAP